MKNNLQNTFANFASKFINNTNRHVFLTGKAGTGKTTFLKYITQHTYKNTAIVAHKTGTGYCNKMVDATNDVGIIFLPKGRFYYISVFVMNAKETQEACERCIAVISKEVYHYM